MNATGQKSLSVLLDEIEQRANAATPGPWEAQRKAFGDWLYVLFAIGVDGKPSKMIASNGQDAGADLIFAASARAYVPRLVKALRYQQEKIQWLARALDDPKLAEHYEKDTAVILTGAYGAPSVSVGPRSDSGSGFSQNPPAVPPGERESEAGALRD